MLVISDEVYDCLTYDGHEHIRIAAFEGMWERTLSELGSRACRVRCIAALMRLGLLQLWEVRASL